MILVTGASGHLGPNLVKRLLDNGEKVRVLVNKGNVSFKEVEVVRGDITDPEIIRTAVKGVDTVYHLAALVDSYGPVTKGQLYKVNVLGTKNLLDNFSGKVIYQSTTSVYGYRPKENPVTASTPYNPSAPYGRTKVEAEKLVLAKGGIAVRAPVIIGPGFNEVFKGLLSGIQKGSIPIIGNGDNNLQWIHVNDLVDALLLANSRGKPGEAYLVAIKQAKTQKELFTLFANLLNVPPPQKHISERMIYTLARIEKLKAKITGKKPKIKAEHIWRIAANRLFNTSKAEKELGFAPKVTYEMWAKDLVAEYLKQTTTKS